MSATSIVQLRPRDAAGLVPPHDLDAERAAVSLAMLDGSCLERVLASVAPRDFYSEDHARALATLRTMRASGEPTDDLVALIGALRRAGAGDGTVQYLTSIVDAPGHARHLDRHLARVRAVAEQRRAIATLQHASASLYTADPDTWRSNLRDALADVTSDAPSSAEPWRVVGVDSMFAPLPPVPYLVQHLDLCPGAPALVAGYGFSGKTMAAQSLALSVATGRALWGSWSVARRGRVVHVDYEQGERLTSERYQRLAYGMGVESSELRDALALVPLPRVSLASEEGRRMLRELADGAALVIVDSLRACAPELDENSSEVRRVLDVMTSVSEETGACFVVVHHARKPSHDAAGGAKASIRGSGAIFDACSSVLVFSGEKGAPVDVSHEKARTSGVTADDFALRIADVDGRAGLRVEATGETRATRAQAAQASAHAERVGAVVRYVVEHPGCGTVEIRDALGGSKPSVDAALRDALDRGLVHDRGPGGERSPRRYHAGAMPERSCSEHDAVTPGTMPMTDAPLKGGGHRASHIGVLPMMPGASVGIGGHRFDGGAE